MEDDVAGAVEATHGDAKCVVDLGELLAGHASYTEGLDPLDLAARAEVALQLVDGETGLATVDLLEPPR